MGHRGRVDLILRLSYAASFTTIVQQTITEIFKSNTLVGFEVLTLKVQQIFQTNTEIRKKILVGWGGDWLLEMGLARCKLQQKQRQNELKCFKVSCYKGAFDTIHQSLWDLM